MGHTQTHSEEDKVYTSRNQSFMLLEVMLVMEKRDFTPTFPLRYIYFWYWIFLEKSLRYGFDDRN